MLDRERIEALFRGGTADQRAAVVHACPPHPFREAAATLSQSDDLVHRVMAMAILATAYCYGRACELGAEIALAGHALGASLVRGGRQDLQPETLSLLAVGAVHALRQLGRGREALAQCDRLVRYQARLDAADPNVDSLRLVRAELVGEQDRFREAEEALAGDVARPPLQALEIDGPSRAAGHSAG